MSMPENEIVVLDIAGDQATLHSNNPAREAELFALGFVREGDEFIRTIVDDDDRQLLVKTLINMGALFSDGRDWCPAGLVDFYIEQGLNLQNYRMISWKSPNNYVISVKSSARNVS